MKSRVLAMIAAGLLVAACRHAPVAETEPERIAVEAGTARGAYIVTTRAFADARHGAAIHQGTFQFAIVPRPVPPPPCEIGGALAFECPASAGREQ